MVPSTCRRSVEFGRYVTWLWMANCVPRDDKNTAFVELHYPLPYQTSLTRHNVRAQQQEGTSDFLNPFSLGTMSASAYIDNLA